MTFDRGNYSQNIHLHGEQLLNYSPLFTALPLSLYLSSKISFVVFEQFSFFSSALHPQPSILFFLHRRSSGRSTYVNFHKYFLHSVPYPWNDPRPKPEGGDPRMQRETISTKLQPSLPFLRFLSLSFFLCPCPVHSLISCLVIDAPAIQLFCPSFRYLPRQEHTRAIIRLPCLINTSHELPPCHNNKTVSCSHDCSL